MEMKLFALFSFNQSFSFIRWLFTHQGKYAMTPKIGAATPRARARLGNVTTRKATDNLPPEAQPFACILENRKDNNKAYEKDNKLLRDLTALQTKQRKAAEKQVPQISIFSIYLRVCSLLIC
jgi:hypothetical protein